MSDVPIVVCTAGPLEGLTKVVSESGLKIGRSADNDIILAEDGVSRFHASLEFDNGTLWLRDAGSRNGLFVNGQRVTDHRALKVGDELTISEHTFAIRWQGSVVDADPTEDMQVDQKSGKSRWFWPFSG
jgi:pSer/pThr/pTyr-binding forkhead associated (FHA) protein